MSKDLEKRWKKKLTSILEELTAAQYKKMLSFLDKIPQSFKTGKAKEQMAQRIIEYYGVKESILAIKEIMDDIPRKDDTVRALLKPFENIVKKQQKKKKDQQRSGQSDKRKNISHLKSVCQLLGTEIIVGKVVKKSGLLKYNTKEMVEKSYFHLVVADRTAGIKVMVYGSERFEKIKEESCYSFKNIIVEGNMIKVTKISTVLKHRAIKVPPQVEKEAQSLFYQRPDCFKAKPSAQKTPTDVGGTAAGVQSAALQTVMIKITRFIKSNKTNTHLEAKVNQQLQEFIVTNRRLAKAFDFTSEEDLKARLQHEPLSAEVKIQGNKIKHIKKM